MVENLAPLITLEKGNYRWWARNMQRVLKTCSCLMQPLPQYIIDDVVNRLEDAKIIAVVETVSRDFLQAGRNVRSLRLVCTREFHDRARAEGELSAEHFTAKTEGRIGQTGGRGEASTSGSFQVSGNENENKFPRFRDLVIKNVKPRPCLIQLRIEVEPRLQSKTVPEGERRRTDHWLSDPHHIIQWIPYVSRTLEHLCIVDYGQQAIMRRTSILKILSESCEYFLTPDGKDMLSTSKLDY